MSKGTLTRRTFLLATATTAVGCHTIGRRAPGKIRVRSPNEIPHVAAIGCGGKGEGDIAAIEEAGARVVALCDVDFTHAAQAVNWWPNVPRYSDFRKMLDKERGIEMVTISTPDHMHTPAVLYAMAMGKHVYVQKPLTITVDEAETMLKAARRYGVATQMGNQGHSEDGVRQTCEWIWDGAIGEVTEVHAVTDRPIWPQGMAALLPAEPIPAELDWDCWVGSAPMLPYNSGYHPFKWRGWWAFGCGALGDMGCHILDSALWALQLGAPDSVECLEQSNCTEYCAPTRARVRYDFPARTAEVRTGVNKAFAPVSLYWYEGGIVPQQWSSLPADVIEPFGTNGSLFIGTKGMLVCGCYGENPRLLPDELARDYTSPAPYLERLRSPYHDWLRAVKEGIPACSHFEYSVPLTEMALLGNVAVRAGRKIEWDGRRKRITNLPHANAYLSRVYREGW
jgi:predicted dehydrogenase